MGWAVVKRATDKTMSVVNDITSKSLRRITTRRWRCIGDVFVVLFNFWLFWFGSLCWSLDGSTNLSLVFTSVAEKFWNLFPVWFWFPGGLQFEAWPPGSREDRFNVIWDLSWKKESLLIQQQYTVQPVHFVPLERDWGFGWWASWAVHGLVHGSVHGCGAGWWVSGGDVILRPDKYNNKSVMFKHCYCLVLWARVLL